MWIPIKLRERKLAKFKIGRHQIERTSQSATYAIMHFCAFSMQIGNNRAYATMPRNEFSKIYQDMQKNPTEATIVVYGYFPGSTDLWWVDFWSDHLKFLFFQVLCFDSCFPRLWKFFVTFGIAASFRRKFHLFPVELTIYYAWFSESFVFFLSITC